MPFAFWLALIIVIYLITPAPAHDHGRPDLNTWFQGLHTPGGTPCCDGSDANVVDDADWTTKDGHYRVRIEGQWVDVPETAVITEPNRAGRAMVWYYYVNGIPLPRCFMPGIQS